MTVHGPERGGTVSPRRFGGFQDNDSDDLRDRVLEDCDPGGARPVSFALFGCGLLLPFDGVEEFFTESRVANGGGRRCKLDVEEEEGADADRFVE